MSLTADRRSPEAEAGGASGVVRHLAVEFDAPVQQAERGILTSVAAPPGHVRLARALAVLAALAATGSGVRAARVAVARLAVREAVVARRGAPVALGSRVSRLARALARALVALARARSLQMTVARLPKIALTQRLHVCDVTSLTLHPLIGW